MLLNHVVRGDVTTATIAANLDDLRLGGNTLVLQTLADSRLVVSGTATGSFYVRSTGLEAPGAAVAIPDVATCAATVHLVAGVLYVEGTSVLPQDSRAAPPPVGLLAAAVRGLPHDQFKPADCLSAAPALPRRKQ